MTARLLRFLPALLVLCLGAAPTGAATISHVAGVPLATTDWTVTLDIPKFDSTVGTLMSVSFEVRDSLVSGFRFENLSGGTCTNRDSSKATVELKRPDNTLLSSTISAKEYGRTMPAFDGVLDFGGTSGFTSGDQVVYESATGTTTAPADLALFTGTGTIGLPCKATGRSYTSETCGNGIHGVSTKAAAYVVVTYVYEPAVPVRGRTWGEIKTIYR